MKYYKKYNGVKPTLRRTMTSLLGFAIVLTSGCGFLGIGKDDPPPLSEVPFETQIIINSNEDINKDADGRPSPVRLRIFLNDDTIDVTALPFETLFEYDSADLPKKPVAKAVAKPDTMVVIPIKGVRSESILTVTAAFRDPFSVRWLDSKTIETINKKSIKVTVQADGVTIH